MAMQQQQEVAKLVQLSLEMESSLDEASEPRIVGTIASSRPTTPAGAGTASGAVSSPSGAGRARLNSARPRGGGLGSPRGGAGAISLPPLLVPVLEPASKPNEQI